MGKSKAAHDILPEELDNLLPCDVGHCFHPLSEVIRENHLEGGE